MGDKVFPDRLIGSPSREESSKRELEGSVLFQVFDLGIGIERIIQSSYCVSSLKNKWKDALAARDRETLTGETLKHRYATRIGGVFVSRGLKPTPTITMSLCDRLKGAHSHGRRAAICFANQKSTGETDNHKTTIPSCVATIDCSRGFKPTDNECPEMLRRVAPL